MTDEERADEYASSYGDDNIIDFGDDQLNLFPLRRWSFLDGLKAGKGMNVPTKWHKVADGDLPSEEGGWVCNQNGLPCYYDWGTEQWLDCEGIQIRTIEWCHMPHKE